MREATVEVRIPGELLEFGFQPQEIQQNLVEWLVLSLFRDERISSGKAARLLGITRLEFLNLLRRRGISYIDFSPVKLQTNWMQARLQYKFLTNGGDINGCGRN